MRKRFTLKNVWMFIINFTGRPRWVVNEDGEMGIRIFGVNLWYYKWETPLIAWDWVRSEGEEKSEYANWRYAEKREFDEVVRSKR